jgi:hypothetical protein
LLRLFGQKQTAYEICSNQYRISVIEFSRVAVIRGLSNRANSHSRARVIHHMPVTPIITEIMAIQGTKWWAKTISPSCCKLDTASDLGNRHAHQRPGAGPGVICDAAVPGRRFALAISF